MQLQQLLKGWEDTLQGPVPENHVDIIGQHRHRELL